MLALGNFRGNHPFTVWEVTALAVLVGTGGAAAVARAKRIVSRAPSTALQDFEFGAAFLASCLVIVAMGGVGFVPIVYLVSAFLVGFFPLRAAAPLLVASGAGLVLLAETVGQAATRVVFLLLFAGLYHLVLLARLRLARNAESNAVQSRLKEVEASAHAYRLVASGSTGADRSAEKWLLAAVRQIEASTASILELAQSALGAHTVAAYLQRPDDGSLSLVDCRAGEGALVERSAVPAHRGVFGAVLRERRAMRLDSDGQLAGVTYCARGGPAVRALVCVPLTEATGEVRGVLVAHRLQQQPFSDDETRLAGLVADEVLRAIEVERVMSYVRLSRDETENSFRAIEGLNKVSSLEQMAAATVASACASAPMDFCAVTVLSEVGGIRGHRIVGSTDPSLEGIAFDDSASLVANVTRYGTPLPERAAPQHQLVFAAGIELPHFKFIKVFPLRAHARSLGTLVVGSRKAVLSDDQVRTIEVIAQHAGEAAWRAQVFENMEKMATMDPLTGLANARAFHARLDELMATAHRYKRSVSLALADVDFFKKVNDTYGHPMGDDVLRGVARILREQARDTDVVARHGGEEFAVVMPETSEAGALVIAERIRQAVKATIFRGGPVPIQVTISLGVATFPRVGSDKKTLIEVADRALYAAKSGGRDRCVCATALQIPQRATGS